MRSSAERIRQRAGIKKHIRGLQREWLSDLDGRRALDLGCGSGNAISEHLIDSADEYLAFDLSEPAIAELRAKFHTETLSNVEAMAGDFMTAPFPQAPFDVVYANSVLHAFRSLDDALSLLFDRMTPGGRLITMEPMKTAWSVWAVRRAARLFRSDAEFNWPFGHEEFAIISKYFEVEAVQGFFGWSKWALPVGFVPGCEGLATQAARKLHEWDRVDASHVGRGLWRCNSVTMCLVRRQTKVSA